MEQVYERCCGLDVHKDTVVACLRVPGEAVRRHKEVRTFGTTTAELLALGDWLMANRCSHAAMDSTGILHDGVPYQELGASHFDRLNAERLARHYVRRLQELGLEVTVQPVAEAA